MKRVDFAPPDAPAEDLPANAHAKPLRLSVLVEMAAGQAAISCNGKKVGEAVKRDELMRGFERVLPDGSTLRAQGFAIPRPPQKPQPEPKTRTKKELMQAIEAGTSGLPGIPSAPRDPASAKAEADAKAEMDALPLFSGGFEPYRVRAWLDGRELREVVGQGNQESARLALVLLLLVGLIELSGGLKLLRDTGATRFLATGPVFLLGALGVWRHWRWSVTLALAVGVADTLVFAMRWSGGPIAPLLATILPRFMLIVSLWRLRSSTW